MENKVLIDKIELGNILLIGIADYESLIERNIVANEDIATKYTMQSGQQFSRLSLKDGLIDRMVAGARTMRGGVVQYCNVSLSIKNSNAGNLVCYTVKQYFRHIEKVKQHLLDVYGILADFSEAKIKTIEINKTFKLDGNFEDYHRNFNLIIANLPKYMKNKMDWKKGNADSIEYQTYYASSKLTHKSKRYLLFKIYNKTKSLENIIMLDDDYARFEFRIVGTEKVKKSLKISKFYELSEQVVNGYFTKQIKHMIMKPYNKWVNCRNRHILELMREQKAKGRYWQINTLRILQNEEIEQKQAVLLDINELLPLIEKLELPSNRRSQARSIFMRQANKFESVFCRGDHLKMDEIMSKLCRNGE